MENINKDNLLFKLFTEQELEEFKNRVSEINTLSVLETPLKLLEAEVHKMVGELTRRYDKYHWEHIFDNMATVTNVGNFEFKIKKEDLFVVNKNRDKLDWKNALSVKDKNLNQYNKLKSDKER